MADPELQAAFDREFRGRVERLTDPVVAVLRKLVSTPLPVGGFEVRSFEVQADWRDFPVYAFAMDRGAVNEEYFEPPFKGKVLPRAGPLVPKGTIDQDRYEEAGGRHVRKRGAGAGRVVRGVLARGGWRELPTTGVRQPA